MKTKRRIEARGNGGLGPIYCMGCGKFFDDNKRIVLAYYGINWRQGKGACNMHKGIKGYNLVDKLKEEKRP